MKVLAVNCGSSSLKFKLVEVRGARALGHWHQTVAAGNVERVGTSEPEAGFSTEGGESVRRPVKVADHGGAMHLVLDWLRAAGVVDADGPEAVGHRIVHGADYFDEPVLIDDEVMSTIERLSELAPLHNLPALAAVRASREALPSVPMAAVFDTAFHRTMPDHASRYAIPHELTEKHGIRRYGFHGTAHRYMVERYAAIADVPVEQTRLVTLQLGNGCSATAVENGRSVETSMGFTPLEGLIMGTRSGSVDPALIPYLAREEGVDVSEVETWLNKRSGLMGVSGVSRDMRELLEAEAAGDERASLAVEMFCHSARKTVGAYLAVLGGADAVVFGGGIGENAPRVRERVCADMEWCGLKLDAERNAATAGVEERVSAPGSRVHAYVIPVDEEAMISRDTARCLHERRSANTQTGLEMSAGEGTEWRG